MKTRIQVLSVENKAGRGKSGNDYNMDIAQCVVFNIDADGVEKIIVGELVLPKNHPKVSPGMFEGEFGISVGQDKRIGGRLVSLFPVPAARTPSPVQAQKPAA